MRERVRLFIRSMVVGALFTGVLFMPIASLAKPLDEAEAVALAQKIFADMRIIADAVAEYSKKNDAVPPNTQALLTGDFLKSIPPMAEGLGQGEYSIRRQYDNMDGRGKGDDAIFSGEKVPEEVCVAFNKLYAEPPLKEGIVFDYAAAGNKYPGEIYGRHHQIFAIKWQSERKVCEIDWVIEYHD